MRKPSWPWSLLRPILPARLTQGPRRANAARNRWRRALRLESLEERRLLAVLAWDPQHTGPTTGIPSGGSGTLSSSGADFYDSSTDTDVVLSSTDDAVFATAGGTVTVSGTASAASLSFTAASYVLTGGTIVLPSGGTSVNVGSGLSTTISSPIIGSDDLTVNGPGTLVLTATDIYSGDTTVNNSQSDLTGYHNTLQVMGSLPYSNVVVESGVMVLGPAAALGQSVTMTGGGVDDLGGAPVIAQSVTITGGAPMWYSATTTVQGGVEVDGGSFIIGAGADLITPQLSVMGGTVQIIGGSGGSGMLTGSLYYASPASSEIDGQISGVTSSVTLNNAAATLTLAGTQNDFGGGTADIAGTLLTTSADSLPDGGGMTVGDASLFTTPAPTPVVFSRSVPFTSFQDYTPDISPAGVIYADGQATLSADDLGLGTPTRVYDSGPTWAVSGGLGWGWQLSDQPYVVKNGSGYFVVFSPEECYSFTENGNGTFTGNHGIKETMSETGGILSFVETDGTVWQFNDYNFDAADARNGQLIGYYSPDGSKQVVTATDADASNQISVMEWYVGGSSHPYQVEDITYYDAAGDPANVGRVSSILLQCWNGTALVDTREVDYTYYDGSNVLYGSAGTLESATEYVFDAGGNNPTPVGMYYYRYHGNRLTLELSPQGVVNAVGSGGLTALRAAGTSTLFPYAAAAYEYQGMGVVKQAAVATVGGLRTYTYTYNIDFSLDFSPNAWFNEVRETRPDGSTDTVFTNIDGETLLTDISDSTGSQHWITYNQYGETGTAYEGMLTLTASPSAIDTSVLSSSDDPLSGAPDAGYDWSQATLGVSLYASAGMLDEYTYATTTTATETSAGDVAGYLQEETLHNGTADTTGVPVESYQYFAHSGYVSTDNGTVSVTIYPTAAATVYRNDDGTGAITTSYAYSWYSGTAQPSEETTYLPIVTTAQNGPGTQWTTKDVYDQYGNLIWEEDANGRCTYHAYDPVTGLETETIADVSSDPRPSGSGLPDPPDALPSSGINATTDYLYDPLGRTIQTLGPAFVDAAGDTVRTATLPATLTSRSRCRPARARAGRAPKSPRPPASPS